MDQVKVILKQLQKYHFWLLSVLCMIVGLVGWFLGARTLSADYGANKASIDSKFTSMKSLQTGDKPPNSKWKDGISKLTEVERKKVRKAWDLVYDEQKALLRWPDQLGEDFLKFVDGNPPDAVIPLELRELYVNEIPAEFPKLLEIVDAARQVSATATGPGGAARPPVKQADTNHEYTVSWAGDSQESLQKLLQWPSIPASEEVRRAQEDLWIYKSLLTIIANRNKGHHVPPIRQITTLEIGRPAAKAFEAGMASNHIDHLQAVEAASAGSSGGGGGGAAKAEDGPQSPDEARYVDAEGKALTAAPEGQFKRMPVHMRVLMDQREITKLLVECANSPLPVEVRQLRVNPSGGKNNPGGGADRPASRSGTEAETFDVPVELHGIIYIFKKPDAATLGGEPAAGEPAAQVPAAANAGGERRRRSRN